MKLYEAEKNSSWFNMLVYSVEKFWDPGYHDPEKILKLWFGELFKSTFILFTKIKLPIWGRKIKYNFNSQRNVPSFSLLITVRRKVIGLFHLLTALLSPYWLDLGQTLFRQVNTVFFNVIICSFAIVYVFLYLF